MTAPRTLDEHLELFAAFAAAVATFDTKTWDRIGMRCATFDGSSVSAIFDRARLLAVPWLFPTSRITETSPVALQILAGVFQSVQTGLAFGMEVSQLFPALRDEPMPARGKSTGSARTDRYYDATRAVETALAQHAGQALGVRAAIRAAGTAVQVHDFLPPEDFARCYSAVSPEIPFEELERHARTV